MLFKIEKEKKYILGNLGQLEQQLTLRVAQDLEKFDKLNKENFKTQIKAVFQEKIQEEFDEKLQERFDSQLTFETEIKKSFKKQLNQQTKILNNLREDQKKLKLDLNEVLWSKYDGDISYRFMAVGHAYTYPTGKSTSNGLNPSFLKFMRASSLMGFRFIIFTGDFTYGGHPKQCLIDDMAEGVRDDTGDGQLGADADAAHHEADLVDDAVGENAAHVVFEQGVDDTVNCHHAANGDEDLPAGESANQRVHRSLCGVSAQDDPAHDGRFRVGVRQPAGERHRRRIDQYADQDEPASDCVFRKRVKRDRASLVDDQQNAG